MFLKKILSVIAYILVPLGLIAVSVIVPEKDTFAAFGSAALAIVAVILFMKPVATIWNIAWLRRLLAYRRQAGVTAFWCALFHGVLFIYDYELYSASHYKGWDNFLIYGVFALVGMIILGPHIKQLLTQKLKKNWKKIQYIAYPTFFFALFHAAQLEEEYTEFLVITPTFIILKFMEWKGIRLRVKKRI